MSKSPFPSFWHKPSPKYFSSLKIALKHKIPGAEFGVGLSSSELKSLIICEVRQIINHPLKAILLFEENQDLFNKQKILTLLLKDGRLSQRL